MIFAKMPSTFGPTASRWLGVAHHTVIWKSFTWRRSSFQDVPWPPQTAASAAPLLTVTTEPTAAVPGKSAIMADTIAAAIVAKVDPEPTDTEYAFTKPTLTITKSPAWIVPPIVMVLPEIVAVTFGLAAADVSQSSG